MFDEDAMDHWSDSSLHLTDPPSEFEDAAGLSPLLVQARPEVSRKAAPSVIVEVQSSNRPVP